MTFGSNLHRLNPSPPPHSACTTCAPPSTRDSTPAKQRKQEVLDEHMKMLVGLGFTIGKAEALLNSVCTYQKRQAHKRGELTAQEKYHQNKKAQRQAALQVKQQQGQRDQQQQQQCWQH